MNTTYHQITFGECANPAWDRRRSHHIAISADRWVDYLRRLSAPSSKRGAEVRPGVQCDQPHA
jgi:hypothetical protein